MRKCAVITGINGQDGSYLADLLLSKGYRVIGVVRRSSSLSTSRIDHLRGRLELCNSNLIDQSSLERLVAKYEPDEFYNLAAMSFVPASVDQPLLTNEVNYLGVVRVLEAIRQVR